MFVLKRDGKKEPMMFDKITARVRKLCYGLNDLVDPVKVAMRVIEGLYDGVSTSELDNLAAEIAATMTTTHPDYAKLAARISISNLHKNTKKSFSETMNDLYVYVNPRTGKKAPLLSDEVHKVIEENAEILDSTIIYNRDFGYDYFGFKTLERSYLLLERFGVCYRDLRVDVQKVLYSCNANPFQCRDAKTTNVLLLFTSYEGR